MSTFGSIKALKELALASQRAGELMDARAAEVRKLVNTLCGNVQS